MSLVALLCTFSNASMSLAKCGFQIGTHYSRWGQTKDLYSIVDVGTDLFLKVHIFQSSQYLIGVTCNVVTVKA